MEEIEEIEKVLEEFKMFVAKDKYRIIERDENYLLMVDYDISEEKRKNVLLELTIDDFVRKDKSRNKKIKGYVYIFHKKVKLLQKYLNEMLDVNLYIKFSSIMEKYVIIISFHESLYG